MIKKDILKRLYKDYSKNYLDKIFLAAFFSILVAGSTSLIAWLLDPAIKKLFIEKDQSLIIIIPLMIIFAFTTKGLSLYFAKAIMIEVGEGVKKKLQQGEASDKDLYDLPPEQLEGIPTVCGSLREALVALENDHDFLLAGNVFTKDQLKGYMELKWEEVHNYEHTPHPVEYSMYYSC